MVEVPFKTEPTSLHGRLNHFDIALSAVGVEYQSNGSWSALIHPLALESVERRELLLLQPLVNWKIALTTLERLRRYAKELEFSVPTDGEAAIWELFYSQPFDVRKGMLEGFEKLCVGGHGVAEEVTFPIADLR